MDEETIKICEAYREGHRAADESAKAAGRTEWNHKDWLVAIKEYERLVVENHQ